MTDVALTEDRPTSTPWALLLLPSRTLLFAFFQALVAAMFLLRGEPAPWIASSAWWPVTVVAANVVSIAVLRSRAHAEGMSYGQLVGFEGFAWRDAAWALGAIVSSAPVAMVPNLALGTWLFGGMEQALALFMHPLPRWAAGVALVGFPLTVAFAELPTYFGYVLPRLGGSRKGAVVLAGLWLAAQHVTLPLVFDARFVLWRSLMFVPFALYVGAVVAWRRRLLPYLMAFHALIDLQVALGMVALSTR